MELLLNLAWLLMVLPAFFLWRESRQAAWGRRFTSLQALLALACALVILFPVVSATDDLHAMRAEIEESPSTKRTVRANSDRAAAGSVGLQSPPAIAENAIMLAPAVERNYVTVSPHSFLPTEPVVDQSGRAPPRAWFA